MDTDEWKNYGGNWTHIGNMKEGQRSKQTKEEGRNERKTGRQKNARTKRGIGYKSRKTEINKGNAIRG